MIVDASVAVKWLASESDSNAANDLLGLPGLAAPELVLSEVANAIWRKRRAGEVGQVDARPSYIEHLVARLVPTSAFINRALDLALAMDHPVYDCVYLAMAEAEDDLLVTADIRFLDACRRAGLAGRLRALGAPL